MDDWRALEHNLHTAAEDMLANSGIMLWLEKMGKPTVVGSFRTGLMVYPDIDVAVQHPEPDVNVGVSLVPRLFDELRASEVKVTDFSRTDQKGVAYFLGLKFQYSDYDWRIAATVGWPGPIVPNPPELADWLANMTEQQRVMILVLKHQLLSARRYGSARSMPPYTFRSVQLYEAVLKGGATTIEEVENYFH